MDLRVKLIWNKLFLLFFGWMCWMVLSLMETHILPLRLKLWLSLCFWSYFPDFSPPFTSMAKEYSLWRNISLCVLAIYLSSLWLLLSPWHAMPLIACHNWLHLSICIIENIYLYDRDSKSFLTACPWFFLPKLLHHTMLITVLATSSHLPSEG